MKRFNRGFTLIELLIVIAVLGTLAVVVLIALNPVQQLARTRDAGRSSTVAQLGRAMEARGTILGGTYPAAGGTWIQTHLVNTGEIQTIPANPAYSAGGVSNGCADASGFCYAVSGTPATAFVIYTTAEALSNRSQCATGNPWFVYSSAAGRGGLWCGNTPAAGLTGSDSGWR